MGQYYKPVNIDKAEFFYSHEFGSGLKLMEHSWMGNLFVQVVEKFISEGGGWFGDRIVWAGDYADKAKRERNNWYLKRKKKVDGCECERFYAVDCGECYKELEGRFQIERYRYLINRSRFQFIDKDRVPESRDGWIIHPLPLMTAESNGRGGGDFHGEDKKGLVGSWAFDVIEASHKRPQKEYSEIRFDLVE